MVLCVVTSNPILLPLALALALLDVSPAFSQHKDCQRLRKKETIWTHVGFSLAMSKAPNRTKSWANACAPLPLFPTASDARRPSPDIPLLSAPCGRLADGAYQ